MREKLKRRDGGSRREGAWTVKNSWVIFQIIWLGQKKKMGGIPSQAHILLIFKPKCAFQWKFNPYVSDSFVLNLSKHCLKIIIWCPINSLSCWFSHATTWVIVTWKANGPRWDSRCILHSVSCGPSSQPYDSPLLLLDMTGLGVLADRGGHPWHPGCL